MCLPVFLSGCKQLLMMVGKTYMSRLWCVMEVFIYMRIKGATSIGELSSQLTIKLLGEDATSISERITRFEAAKAQCRHDRDRQKLLAVIEASFGTTAPFDELVVKVFNEQVIGVKGLQRQIDTMRRQMVKQQEAIEALLPLVPHGALRGQGRRPVVRRARGAGPRNDRCKMAADARAPSHTG